MSARGACLLVTCDNPDVFRVCRPRNDGLSCQRAARRHSLLLESRRAHAWTHNPLSGSAITLAGHRREHRDRRTPSQNQKLKVRVTSRDLGRWECCSEL
jgi:hypothetical protein